MRKFKITVGCFALAAASIAMVGCSNVSESAVEGSNEYITLDEHLTSTEVTYFDGTNQTKMIECRDRGFLDPTCYKTPDDSITIEYVRGRSAYGQEIVTVDGERFEGLCVTYLNGLAKCWHDGQPAKD